MEDISADELQRRMHNKEQLNLLDVRELIEFHTRNIGGIHFPLSTFSEKESELPWNKTTELIVICKLGIRSESAKLILENLGYLRVRNLEGGLIALQKIHK